jgi:hypothetical protein
MAPRTAALQCECLRCGCGSANLFWHRAICSLPSVAQISAFPNNLLYGITAEGSTRNRFNVRLHLTGSEWSVFLEDNRTPTTEFKHGSDLYNRFCFPSVLDIKILYRLLSGPAGSQFPGLV